MGTNECSRPASQSSWDSQDFGDVNVVLKMTHFHKSSRPQWVNGQFYQRLLQVIVDTTLSLPISMPYNLEYHLVLPACTHVAIPEHCDLTLHNLTQ